jgi:hypothetical protein
MTATMRLPSIFGIACSKTGLTSSELCVSPGETHSAVTASASPEQAIRTILFIVLPSCILAALPERVPVQQMRFGWSQHKGSLRNELQCMSVSLVNQPKILRP